METKHIFLIMLVVGIALFIYGAFYKHKGSPDGSPGPYIALAGTGLSASSILYFFIKLIMMIWSKS